MVLSPAPHVLMGSIQVGNINDVFILIIIIITITIISITIDIAIIILEELPGGNPP